MADKSPRKPGGKKPGKTLKEKRTAKTRTLNRGSGSGVERTSPQVSHRSGAEAGSGDARVVD